jgi:hypothetical protein
MGERRVGKASVEPFSGEPAKPRAWSKSDHIRFGTSLFCLGFIVMFSAMIVLGQDGALLYGIKVGLYFWLGPLIFFWWLRFVTNILEKVFPSLKVPMGKSQ